MLESYKFVIKTNEGTLRKSKLKKSRYKNSVEYAIGIIKQEKYSKNELNCFHFQKI